MSSCSFYDSAVVSTGRREGEDGVRKREREEGRKGGRGKEEFRGGEKLVCINCQHTFSSNRNTFHRS
jgi:hypothetical protein